MYNNSDAPETRTPPPHPITLPSSPSSSSSTFCAYTGADIDDALLERCADLFSSNYGIWGEQPISASGRAPKPGDRVKMSLRMFRRQLLSAPDKTVVVACFRDDSGVVDLIGHAFATVWDYDAGNGKLGKVGWVTQLVVQTTERKRYIATQLLQQLKKVDLFRGVTAVGLVSSHAGACNAISKYIRAKIQDVDLDFCRKHAPSILRSSPVEYIRSMLLRGSLFEDHCTSGAVCSVFTSFYVDHTEPLAVLNEHKAHSTWPLGELLDGHEFLVIHAVDHKPFVIIHE